MEGHEKGPTAANSVEIQRRILYKKYTDVSRSEPVRHATKQFLSSLINLENRPPIDLDGDMKGRMASEGKKCLLHIALFEYAFVSASADVKRVVSTHPESPASLA